MNFNSLRKEIISNNASVKELVSDIFVKIDHKDPEINSYICTTKYNAISQAEKIDKLIQNKEKLPPLAGIPIAIKDNICTKGVALQLACSKTISLEELISFSKKNNTNPIILALDGITDPHNVGAIIRSAEAFDCKGIIIPQRRSAGLTGTVAKVAAGALEHLPVSRVVNLNRALEELRKKGFLVIGLSGEGQTSISTFHHKNPLVVVVGSEDKGISLLTQKKCDYLLNIPLKGKTSSLNASVATAISLFHLSGK